MSRQLLSACEKASFCSQWQLIHSFFFKKKQTLINLWPQHSNYRFILIYILFVQGPACGWLTVKKNISLYFSDHCLWLKWCLLPFLLLFTWQLPILSWWFVYPAHKPAVIVWGRISASNISPVQSNTLLTALSNGRQLVLEKTWAGPLLFIQTTLSHRMWI